MTSTQTNSYTATFIFDLRNSEDGIEKVVSDVTEVLGGLGCEVTATEDLGTRDFARAADRRFASGHYYEFVFNGPPSAPSDLQEKLRLDKRVNRIMSERT